MKKLLIGFAAFLIFSAGLIIIPHSTFAADNLFGTINSPTGNFGTHVEDVGTLIGVGIRTFFVVAGLTALVFMLWGALNWVTSGGDKEKLQKAQARIRNAVIGMIMVLMMLALFVIIFGIVLGNKIIDVRNGFKFNVPSINPPPAGPCPPVC
jgi:predicted nucleic acid-binding Zn ribbon protein